MKATSPEELVKAFLVRIPQGSINFLGYFLERVLEEGQKDLLGIKVRIQLERGPYRGYYMTRAVEEFEKFAKEHGLSEYEFAQMLQDHLQH